MSRRHSSSHFHSNSMQCFLSFTHLFLSLSSFNLSFSLDYSIWTLSIFLSLSTSLWIRCIFLTQYLFFSLLLTQSGLFLSHSLWDWYNEQFLCTTIFLSILIGGKFWASNQQQIFIGPDPGLYLSLTLWTISESF